MNDAKTIAAVLVDYLQPNQEADDKVDVNTDLLDSGRLDSLSVVDLVCFITARFQIRMAPVDISPKNLRTVGCLAAYLEARLACRSKAA